MGHQPHGVVAVGRLAHHLQPVLGEQITDSLAQQIVVVDDDDANRLVLVRHPGVTVLSAACAR